MSAQFECTLIHLERLSGTRESATAVCVHLVSRCELVLDASKSVSVAQGFADQIIKETLVDRAARKLTVRDASPRLINHLVSAASVRGVRDRLVITT